MANIGGNQAGLIVEAVNVDTTVSQAHNSRILNVSAGASDINITLASAATVPNGVNVIIKRNASSTSDVVIGAPISKTLDADTDTCEVICNGTTWLELSRGSSAVVTHANTHADGGTDEVTPLAIGAPSLHGFVDRSATLAFNDATLKLTITPSTSFSFWINGNKFVKTVAQEVTIDNTAGLHFCSESDAGALQKSMDAWDIAGLTAIPAAIVWWNSVTGRVWEERHGYRRDPGWHKTQHLTEGAKYYSGLGLTLPTTGTPGDFQLESGYIFDEDLQLTIGQQTTCIRCYRTNAGAAMTFDSTPSEVPYRMNGSNLEYDAGASGVVNASSNNYVNYWLYVTNDIAVPAYSVLGQASHTTLAAARAEGRPTIPMSTAEWVLAYRLTYRNTGATPTLSEITDYRAVQSGPPVNYTAPASVAAQNVLVDATGYTGTLASKTTAQLAFDALDAVLNQSVQTGASPQFAAVNVGHASDTTLSRKSAGVLQVEANELYVQGGTDVAVADGGTGASTLASNGVLYGNGTSAVQALAVNSTATRKYLSQVSSGAPTWETVAATGASRYRLRRGC